MEKVIIEGVVEHGRRLGRELGFPTANVAVPDSVAAEDGVYRSRAEMDGAVYDAMSNLGRNPSVGGTARRLETHIFGFRGALYGVGSLKVLSTTPNANTPLSGYTLVPTRVGA